MGRFAKNGKVIISTEVSTQFGNVTTTIDSFSSTHYRTAKYIVSITNGFTYQTAEVSVIHDGSATYSTVYGIVSSTGTPFVTFSTSISSNIVLLSATGVGAGTNVARLQRTYVV